MEMSGFCGDSWSICQQFEGIVYLGLKQRLHDRWRRENSPKVPGAQHRQSTRKLLSADSFISVDIYQLNYPCSFSNVYYYQQRCLFDVHVCERPPLACETALVCQQESGRGLSLWKFSCILWRRLKKIYKAKLAQ